MDELSDTVVPVVMRASAEIIRHFYSQVDNTAPTITIDSLSTDPADPTTFALPAGGGNLELLVNASATDDISGVDQNGFQFLLDESSSTSALLAAIVSSASVNGTANMGGMNLSLPLGS